eukprot:scpid78249/ scgid3216/ Leucine-rich repeat-containing protein 34
MAFSKCLSHCKPTEQRRTSILDALFYRHKALEACRIIWERCSRNKIAPDGAEYLATYLSLNGALKALNLESNRIQDGGTLALARALTTGRSGLEWLNIKFNSIQPEGLKAMARAIRASCALRYVYVWGNEFDHDTCQDYTYLLSGAVPRVSVEGGLDISTYIVDGVCSVAHVECKEFKPLFKRKRFRV